MLTALIWLFLGVTFLLGLLLALKAFDRDVTHEYFPPSDDTSRR